MRAVLLAILLPFVTSLAALAEEQSDGWEIHGIVLDEAGKPTDDFDAAGYWSSNGKQWDDNGEWLRPKTEAEKLAFWNNEGVLAVHPSSVAKHESDGKFTLYTGDRPRISVFVANKQRTLGGYVAVEQTASDKPIEIKLQPLTRVHGKFDCPDAGRTPEWTMAIIHPPGDRENYLHFVHCGSKHGKLEVLLPAGTYDLVAYSTLPEARMPKPKDLPADKLPSIGGLRFEVPAAKDFDLGKIELVLPRDKDGIPRDYSLYYGKQPPDLQFTDIRGLKKDFKLADLRGKWVLLDFWTLHCGPCIARSLPELTKIYEEHAADRDRFEIVAICDTSYESAPTLEAYNKLAAPIIEKQWSGKDLSFPVVIDGDGRTTGLYGIQSWPTALLIDPEGNMVKGDETVLREKLTGH